MKHLSTPLVLTACLFVLSVSSADVTREIEEAQHHLIHLEVECPPNAANVQAVEKARRGLEELEKKWLDLLAENKEELRCLKEELVSAEQKLTGCRSNNGFGGEGSLIDEVVRIRRAIVYAEMTRAGHQVMKPKSQNEMHHETNEQYIEYAQNELINLEVRFPREKEHIEEAKKRVGEQEKRWADWVKSFLAEIQRKKQELVIAEKELAERRLKSDDHSKDAQSLIGKIVELRRDNVFAENILVQYKELGRVLKKPARSTDKKETSGMSRAVPSVVLLTIAAAALYV